MRSAHLNWYLKALNSHFTYLGIDLLIHLFSYHRTTTMYTTTTMLFSKHHQAEDKITA